MTQTVYRLMAKINKAVLPSYTKRGLDISNASKLQLVVLGWRYFITSKALG